MSIRVLSAVWDDATVGRRDLLVLLALADHADDTGRCYPSLDRIALKARLGRRSTIDAIKRLESSGHIEIKRNAGPNGTNVYHVKGCKICTGAKNAPVQFRAPELHPNRNEPSNKERNAREPAVDKSRPASVAAVLGYASDLNQSAQAEPFWDHFESVGWRVGTGTGKPMRDWRAAFRKWCRRASEFAPKSGSASMTYAEMTAHAKRNGLTSAKKGHYRVVGKDSDGKPLWRAT